MYIIYGMDTACMRDQRIPMFVRALTPTRVFNPSLLITIHENILSHIIKVTQQMQHPLIFPSLYLLCFFSFLRLSNILPHSVKNFDILRQLCRGDLIFSQNSVVIIIKWSKTLQDRRNVATVTIPALGTSMLCPVKALRDMYASFLAAKDDPLFVYNKNSLLLPLTDSMARKHLKLVSQLLDYPKHFTFHDFRRGGATWALGME